MTASSSHDARNASPPEVAPPRSVRWWGPRWRRARELRKLAPSVLGLRSIARITAVSLVIGVAVCVGVLIAFPNIPPAVFWQALVAIPLGIAPLPLFCLALLWVPESVGINRKYVGVSHGQSHWHARLTDIEQAELIILSDEHLLLRLRVRGRLHSIGVSPKANLHGLTALLTSTIVRDQRRQFAAARRLVEQARRASLSRSTPHAP